MYKNINFIKKKNYLIIFTIHKNLQLFFIYLLYFDFHTIYITIIISSLLYYLIVKFLMKIIFDLNNLNFYLFIIYLLFYYLLFKIIFYFYHFYQ